MVSAEEHRKTIRELEEDLNEKLRAGILAERQKIVGFAASEASTNAFALLMHKLHLISEGAAVNHRWFASAGQANQRFPFAFPQREELLAKLVRQEQLRDRLCYGRAKSAKEAEEAVQTFFEIKVIVERAIGEEL